MVQSIDKTCLRLVDQLVSHDNKSFLKNIDDLLYGDNFKLLIITLYVIRQSCIHFLRISWIRMSLFKICQNCVFYYRGGISKQRELHAFLFNISCVLRLWCNLYLAGVICSRDRSRVIIRVFFMRLVHPMPGAPVRCYLKIYVTTNRHRCNYYCPLSNIKNEISILSNTNYNILTLFNL